MYEPGIIHMTDSSYIIDLIFFSIDYGLWTYEISVKKSDWYFKRFVRGENYLYLRSHWEVLEIQFDHVLVQNGSFTGMVISSWGTTTPECRGSSEVSPDYPWVRSSSTLWLIVQTPSTLQDELWKFWR